MKRIVVLCSTILLSVPLTALAQTTTTTIIPPGAYITEFGDATSTNHPGTCEDTYIYLSSPTWNYSNSIHLLTSTTPNVEGGQRIIMHWDLSALPPYATIHSATLSLYMLSSGHDPRYDISAHKVINHNPEISSCTWNTYDGIHVWTGGPNGGAYDMAHSEESTVVGLTPGYKSWNITNMVRDWVNDPSLNYGLILNPDSSISIDDFRVFESTEYGNLSQRPKLIVTYTPYPISTTTTIADTAPPDPPPGLRIDPDEPELTLPFRVCWDRSTEADIAFYTLYYGISSRNYSHYVDVDKQYTCFYFDEDRLTREGIYGPNLFVAITSTDYSLNESEFSEEMVVSIPLKVSVTSCIAVEPNTLNINSHGQWITVYIELPEEYDPAQINASNILLNDQIVPILDPQYGFVINEESYLVDEACIPGVLERMLKFDRAAVAAILVPGDEVKITISGELNDGILFEGSDVIRVIDKGK